MGARVSVELARRSRPQALEPLAVGRVGIAAGERFPRLARLTEAREAPQRLDLDRRALFDEQAVRKLLAMLCGQRQRRARTREQRAARLLEQRDLALRAAGTTAAALSVLRGRHRSRWPGLNQRNCVSSQAPRARTKSRRACTWPSQVGALGPRTNAPGIRMFATCHFA